jgi:prevent-host-death family protein
MDVLTYTDTRAKLKEVMDRVVDDHHPVVITRQKAEAVVMVSLADWNAMEETVPFSPARGTPSAFARPFANSTPAAVWNTT